MQTRTDLSFTQGMFMIGWKIFLTLFLAFNLSSSLASAKSFSCYDLKSIKSSLERIKTKNEFNSANPKVIYAWEKLTDVYEGILTAKSDEETSALLSVMSKCFSNDVSEERVQNARARSETPETEFEEESFSALELVCAGFSVKEILAIASAKTAIASGSAGVVGTAATATTATIAVSTTVSIAAAAVSGWLIGEGIIMIDSQTGNHIRRPLDKYIVTPLVFWWMDVPTESEMLRDEARGMAIRQIRLYKEKKFALK